MKGDNSSGADSKVGKVFHSLSMSSFGIASTLLETSRCLSLIYGPQSTDVSVTVEDTLQVSLSQPIVALACVSGEDLSGAVAGARKWASLQLGHSFCSPDIMPGEQPGKGVCARVYFCLHVYAVCAAMLGR